MPSVRPVVKELRALTVLALPIAAGQAGFALMGLVDTAVVGRLGAGPLGAVGLANGLFFALSVIGIGTMMGLDPLISQALGARDERRARELLWQGLWLGAALSAALTGAVLALPALLRPAGIEPSVAEDTRAFLWMRVIGMAPMLWFVGIRSYLQSVGRVKSLLTAAVVANVLNLFGDVLFVYGGARLPAWTGLLRSVPAFGAAGAGLTTSVCSFIQVAIIAWPAWRTPWTGGPARRRARMADLMKAARVGLPVGMQMAAEVGVFALAGLFAGRMGKESLAAHQVALALASFTFCAAVGVGAAGGVRVGRAIGERDAEGTRRAGLAAFGLGAGIMSVAALAFWLTPGPIIGILTDRPDVIAATRPLLLVAAFFQISDGVQGTGAGVLRGAGDTRFAFLANVVGHYAVGLPVALLLGFKAQLGIVGIWWGLCGGLAAVAAALLTRFVRASRRGIAPLEAHPAVAVEEMPLAPLAAPPLPATAPGEVT